jgi:hypothetical protein
MYNLLLTIMGALCCASISFTITYTGLFKPLREWLSPIHKKIEDLFHCPWCFGHWCVFILLLTSDLPWIIISKWAVYNFLFTAFVMTAVQGLLHYVLLRAYEPVAKYLAQRKIDALKKKNKQ